MATVNDLLPPMLADLPAGDEVIPLPLVRRIINAHLSLQWDRALQSTAVKAGTIRVLSGNTHGLMVDREEARLILGAAVVAEVAQAPVVTMIRAFRAAMTDETLATLLAQAA